MPYTKQSLNHFLHTIYNANFILETKLVKVPFNSILIYDDLCPLCEWYTKLFLKLGFIKPEQKKSFSNLDPALLQLLDIERACKEIPLLNAENKTVLYGVDSLLEILNQKIPFVKAIGKFAPINWILKKLYKLISFNRKGIVARVPKNILFDCTPLYNYNYKKYFITICFVLSCVLLYKFGTVIQASYINAALFINGLSVLWAIFSTNKNQLETIMQWQLQVMIMVVMLLPLLLFISLPEWLIIAYALAVGIVFTFQIQKRILYLKHYWSKN